jgi:hypothetical protein
MMVGMFAFELIACSGPGAFRVMAEAQAYGVNLAQISFAIVAVAVMLAWMRSFAFASSSMLIVAAIAHPGLWMSAYRGDCGSTLRACAMIWTILIAVVAVGVVVNSWRKGRKLAAM